MASAYERFRPGYPGELVDEVLAYAGRPVRTALEVGAGTGKATRVFASRGIAVTATDPDPAMLAELRKHVPETVGAVQASFEDLPLTPVYDLVFAAASFHWTQPDHRWERVAAMLRRDGIFASFGGQMYLGDTDVEQAVCAARAEFLADDGVPSPDGTPADSPMQWPGSELLRSGRFTRCAPVDHRTSCRSFGQRLRGPPLNDLCLPQTARNCSRARVRADPQGAPRASDPGIRPHPPPCTASPGA